MKTILYGLCIATLMAAAPAPASTSADGARAASSSAATSAVVADKEKGKAADAKICKQLPSTGSRLPQRACLTAKEWAQVEADSE